MKTVTIPTCANPFVVIVNGIKYTYPAGATMEVPDDVAEVIEQHEEAKPEPAPVAPPFASGASGGESGGGGGLPVVELTTVVVFPETGDGEESELSSTESALLSAAAEKKLPCAIVVPLGDGLHFSGVGIFTDSTGFPMYEIFNVQFGIVFYAALPPESTTWSAYFSKIGG